MPRRQSSTPLEQAVLVRHLVSWWLYLLLAAFCWLGLRAIAQWALPSSRIGDGSATLLHSFALVGQVLLPLALQTFENPLVLDSCPSNLACAVLLAFYLEKAFV